MQHRYLPLAALIPIAAALWVVWQRDLPMRDSAVLGAGLSAAGLFALAAVWDILFGRVEDRLLLGLAWLYVPWYLLTWPGYGGFVLAGIAFLIAFVASMKSIVGGGAGKLLIIAALWVGTDMFVTFLLAFAVCSLAAWLLSALFRRKAASGALVFGAPAAYVLLIKLEPLSGWQMPLG